MLQEVLPDSEPWANYLKFYADYLLETWPEEFLNKSTPLIIKELDAELRKRVEEGGRHFFVYQKEQETIGLANIYLHPHKIPNTSQKVLTLHVAEFSILPARRRKRFGSRFLEELIAFGKRKKIRMVWADVDIKNKRAIPFWKKNLPESIRSKERIAFWKPF